MRDMKISNDLNDKCAWREKGRGNPRMFPQLGNIAESHMTSITCKAKEQLFPRDSLAHILLHNWVHTLMYRIKIKSRVMCSKYMRDECSVAFFFC